MSQFENLKIKAFVTMKTTNHYSPKGVNVNNRGCSPRQMHPSEPSSPEGANIRNG
jgi:hypothetical protein